MTKYIQTFTLSLIIIASVHAQVIPPIPTNVTALGLSGEHPRVLVTWQAPLGPWYCNLYRSAIDTLHFTRIGQFLGRSFEDHGVMSGRTYYYFVKSVAWNDSVLVESGRSNIASATVGSTPRARGTIRGAVIDDSTGAPIRSVRVRFYRQSNNWSGVYDITDSLGRYEAEMDTGRYLIRADPPFEHFLSYYLAEWFDNVLEPSAATTVVVGNGTTFTANFGLRRIVRQRYSLMSGVVRNEQGQPVSGATVAVMRSIQEMSYIAATTGTIPGLGIEERVLPGIGYARGVMAYDVTDPQGRFSAGVPANGSYIVAAGKTGFYPEYFNNTADPTQATIIAAANDTNGVNFSLRAFSTSPNSVRGVVRDSTGTQVPSRVILFPRPPGGGTPTQVVHSDAGGVYALSNVQAGTYSVLAVPYSNFTVGFYKEGQYGISQWQIADSIVVGSSVVGVNVGVVPIQSIGLTRVSGISVSSSGEPLVGGRIVVKNSLGEVLGNGISTAGGGYSVNALPTGQVTFIVDREPYNSELLVINIPPGTYNLNNINIVLTRTGATAVSETGGLPRAFTLAQNYPNPFNPTTKLSFVIGHSSLVSLKVFDVLGREVATLVDEEQKAGEKSVVFDARDLSSGIYYYRLNAGRFSDVKKMLLLR